MTDRPSIELELSDELLELGEVAGFLRPREGKEGPVVGFRPGGSGTPLVMEKEWFSEPLGKRGLGGLPGRLDVLFQLLESAGLLGPKESPSGPSGEVPKDGVRWYPILDPSSGAEKAGSEAATKSTGLYVTHDPKEGLIGFAYRRELGAGDGPSLRPSAVLPLFRFAQQTVEGGGSAEESGWDLEFVTGTAAHPVRLGVEITAPQNEPLEAHGFKVGSFEIDAELSAHPRIDFRFRGLGVPGMDEPDFPGSDQSGELNLATIEHMAENREAWLDFAFEFLIVQLGESGKALVANLVYLLGLRDSNRRVEGGWSGLLSHLGDGHDASGWIESIMADPRLFSRWLYGWFCLFQGIDVNEKPPPEHATARVALIDLPGIATLVLTVEKEGDVITPELELESPVFEAAAGIGVQLLAKASLVRLDLSSGSIEGRDPLPALDIRLKLRNPEGDGSSEPLFSHESGSHGAVSLDSVELSLEAGPEGIAPSLQAKALGVHGERPQDRTLPQLLSDSSAEGSGIILRPLAEALKVAYQRSLPEPRNSPSDFVEKFIDLRDYGRLLRVVANFSGVEVPEGEDPFCALIDELVGGLERWAKPDAGEARDDLAHEAASWFLRRVEDGGLAKALGEVLGESDSGVSVEGNRIRFEAREGLALSLGFEQEGLVASAELGGDSVLLELAGGIALPGGDLTVTPEVELTCRVAADPTRFSSGPFPALPELFGRLSGDASGFALGVLPGGGDGGGGITLLPEPEAGWLEKLVLLTLLPVAADAALAESSVQSRLAEPFPRTSAEDQVNLEQILVRSQLVTQDARHLSPLATLEQLTPESVLKAVLEVLTGADRLEIAEGIALVKHARGARAEVYGLQMQLPDVAITKPKATGDGESGSKAAMKLQVGKWLGMEGADNWIQKAGGSAEDDGAGLKLFMVSADGTFEPGIELVSVGLDIEGAEGKALFEAKGYELKGLQPRVFFSWSRGEDPEFGAAVQLEQMSIPLGPKAGGDSAKSNPVAGNLLSSGDSSKGKQEDAVNPSFSALVAYVRRFHGEVFSDVPSADGKAWIPVGRNFGPLHCRQVGIGLEDRGEPWLGVGYDGGVALGPLAIELDHLTIDIPLERPQNVTDYELGLAGLEISYAGGPVSIDAAFLKSTGPTGVTQYDGTALIKAAGFTVTGFGSYAVLAGEPSMYIFAILHKDLGGPSFFHVTGLAAGFGYNRALELPPIEEVEHYPLVRGALEDNYFDGSDPEHSSLGAMEKLQHYIPPSLGDYWFAAGVRFTSFEMIESFALLSVSFGHQLEVGLLGMSKMVIPRGASPGNEIAYAELAIRAVIKPEEGLIAIDGKLTDESYIFSKNCRLTGGFAFYLWADGVHAGDFVLTLGGYHSDFDRPEHYPNVPRLRANWQVSSELSIVSEMYFALTPSCLMAGGKMSAVYETSCVRAWYTAYADFLLSWKPFFYLLDMGIGIGVEAHLRIPLGFCTVSISISIHLSVDLHVWGPEFGGEIELDLGVTTLTIGFGADKAAPPPLQPKEFVESFLPPAQEVVATRITGGLLREEHREGGEVLRVVNGHALSMTTQSLIPTTKFGGLATAAGGVSNAGGFGIRSMGAVTLESIFGVEVDGFERTPENLRASPVETGVPEALWGKSAVEGKAPLPGKPAAKTIRATSGIRIAFAPKDPEGALEPMEIAKFAYEDFYKPIPWEELQPAGDLEATYSDHGIESVMGPSARDNRQAVLEVLGRDSPFELNRVDLQQLVENRDAYFQHAPEIKRLGQEFV